MPLETYRERIADSRHPRGVRQRLVQHYLERRSVSLTARAFRCDRKPVRLWVQRYQQGGRVALLYLATEPAPRLGQAMIQAFWPAPGGPQWDRIYPPDAVADTRWLGLELNAARRRLATE